MITTSSSAASAIISVVLGPAGTGSARSNHSSVSTWQKYGPVASSCRQMILAPWAAASRTISAWCFIIVSRGEIPVVWMSAHRTVSGIGVLLSISVSGVSGAGAAVIVPIGPAGTGGGQSLAKSSSGSRSWGT